MSVKEKLPIYAKPPETIVLVQDPTRLELGIRHARHKVQGWYSHGSHYVQGGVERWIGFETRVERRIKSIIPANESLMPGFLYVGVVTLTGSILARSRSRALRVVLPSAFFLGSLAFFLPQTTRNLGGYVSELERRYAPGFAAQHERVAGQIGTGLDSFGQKMGDSVKKVTTNVIMAVGEVERRTGIKIRDAFPGLDSEKKDSKK